MGYRVKEGWKDRGKGGVVRESDRVKEELSEKRRVERR